jgi:hypothetical protein
VTDLVTLCVTAGEEYSHPFVAALQELSDELGAPCVVYDGAGAGAIEAVLDDALELAGDRYVLRVDDDELVSPAMREWLHDREYRASDHWAFPRVHLYPDLEHYVTQAPLWPDLQTRLSVRSKAGRPAELHAGSPYGTGRVAPVALEHHKFLVRSWVERRELLERYDEIRAGAGSRFVVFSLPELFDLEVAGYPPAELPAVVG